MAFKRMRELDGVLPVPQLEPDEPKQMTATIRRGTGYEQRIITNF